MDSVTASHIASREGWQGTLRGIACAAIAGFLGWKDHEVAKYSLGVIALVASPALARAIIAPRIASLLRKENENVL